MVAALENQPEWRPLTVKSFGSSSGGEYLILENGSVLLTGEVPDKVTYTGEFETDLQSVAGFRLEALTHPDLPGRGPGRGDAARPNFVLNEFRVAVKKGVKESQLKLQNAEADFSQKNWDIA